MKKRNLKSNSPIGVFDSGIGGLTVVKEILRQLPGEDIVYFGDTARVPYGTKSKEAIIRFSKENTKILLKRKVKMVVVACNSSTSYALETLQRHFDVPVVGVIRPGVRKAVATTKKKAVGVIATPATIKSGSYTKTLLQEDAAVRVVTQACPLFVPLVEEGWYDKDVTLSIAQEYLGEMKKAKVDALILGCTHYPLLKNTLGRVMGPSVTLIDSAEEVVKEVRAQLEALGLLKTSDKKAVREFLVSDDPRHFERLAGRFLEYELENVKRVEHV